MTTICKIFNIDNKLERRKTLINFFNKIKTSSSEENLENSSQLSLIQFVSFYCVKTNSGKVDLAKRILNDIYHVVYNSFDGTVTLTFGDVAESHVGMQKIGSMDEKGFSLEDLTKAKVYFDSKNIESKIIHLNNFLPVNYDEDDCKEKRELELARSDPNKQAYVLIVRGGVGELTNSTNGNSLLTEVLFYHWDNKLYNTRRKVVQNKLARSNLNFSDKRQVSDFENGKGTTISFSDVPILNDLRSKLANIIGSSASDLKCEGNLYNLNKQASKATGIGYHGDTERRKVIGCRLGNNSMNMHFMWYYNNLPRGLNVSFTLNPGDMYMMSEKTVGTDWRPNRDMGWYSKSYVLRHAAGAAKYTSKTAAIKLDKPFNWDEDCDIHLSSINHRKKGKEWVKMPQ